MGKSDEAVKLQLRALGQRDVHQRAALAALRADLTRQRPIDLTFRTASEKTHSI